MSPPPRDRGEADEARRIAALESELREIYREVDAAHEGWSCDASTDCCHFARTGREPYVTTIEARLVARARAALGGKPTKERRLPMARDERRCPLLDDGGRCSVYASRPFGCRTFYCERATPGERVRQREINAFVARIRGIAARYTPGRDTGAPLTRALDALGRGTSTR
ncbi:MAG: YkgJ family cysteine cluster protein [Polyangiaceae bacterium]